MMPLPAAAIRPRARAAILVLVVSAAFATGIGLGAWHLLPYEGLQRDAPAERFLLWEAVMWLTGLALALFGLAAWFGATDLYATHGDVYLNRSSEHVRRQVKQGVRGQSHFAYLPAAPWLMMGTGTLSMLLAAIVRRVVVG